MASDYGEGIINRLHPDSPLRQEGNPARTLIMKTIGAWLDNHDVTELYDNSFLETVTGKWLDLYGNDLGVLRRLDESDEDYRTRLIYESIGNLSIDYLLNVFDLSLYSFREDFDIGNNTLVSDNPFLNTGGYISVADRDVISVLDRKLLLDGSISWVNSKGNLDYILNTDGINVLSNYSKIYYSEKLVVQFRGNESIVSVRLGLNNAIDCRMMFENCSNLNSVDLILPNATNCNYMFEDCSDLDNPILDLPKVEFCGAMFKGCSMLVSIDLNLPNATRCEDMFRGCVQLTEVKLNLPKLRDYANMFYNASIIKTIDVNIPTSKVDGFKSYVLGLNLQHLTSFIINGEEQL